MARLAGFARRALDVSLTDHARADEATGWTFFDRGVVDAAVALTDATALPLDDAVRTHCYHHIVFLAPPWPAIFATDPDRRHDIDTAISEHERLAETLPTLGYEVLELLRTSVPERCAFVLAALD